LADAFTRVDVLALPTIATSPPALEDADRLTEIRYVAPFNLAGVPALSLPVVGATGPVAVPASLQLAGPARSEELLVATAAALEEAAGFRSTAGRG
jgi:Asp-tRNA(Asn)/Glu-tRNA(Gln) amidotransferase A subunit family amidase